MDADVWAASSTMLSALSAHGPAKALNFTLLPDDLQE